MRSVKVWVGGGRALLLAAVLMTFSTAAPGEGDRAAKLQGALDVFCTMWMGFLEERERDNKQKIAWREVGEGVEGDFIGYDKKYTCQLSALRPDTKTPVGTIKYLEFKYRHKGDSSSQALSSTPKIIEATEVTEIFRYSKNEWVY